MHVPGLKVVCVSDAYDAKGILKSAVRDDNPVLIFEHKLLYGSKGREQAGGLDLTAEVPTEEYLVPLDKAIVKRPGDHVTVVATHLSLYRASRRPRSWRAEGIECEVIDPLTLLPLDTETIWASVRKTGRLVIVHEDTLHRRLGRRGRRTRGRRVPLLAGGADQAHRDPRRAAALRADHGAGGRPHRRADQSTIKAMLQLAEEATCPKRAHARARPDVGRAAHRRVAASARARASSKASRCSRSRRTRRR